MAFDSDKFLKSLGAEDGLIGYKFTVPGQLLPARITGNASEDPEIRKLIELNTPEQFLDALVAGDPKNVSLKNLVGTIKSDPELAKALHNAVVKDETMLPGLQKMAENTDPNSPTNLDALNKVLTNPLAREKAKENLNQIATTDLTFANLETSLKKAESLHSIGEILDRMKNDPEGLVNDLLANSGLEGTQIGQFLRNMLSGMMPFFAEVTDMENGPYAGYAKLGKGVWNRGVANGQEMETYDIDDRTSAYNMDRDDFRDGYNKIYDEKIAAGAPDNVYTALDTMKEVDHLTRAEVKAIKREMETNADFRTDMESIAAGGAESMMALQDQFVMKQSIRNAVENLKNGITADDIWNEQKEALKVVDEVATVTALDDTTFQQAVTGDLKGSSPVSVQKIFDAMRQNVAPDAVDEINALESRYEAGDKGLTTTFGRMATLNPEEIGKAANELYDEMEKGTTPREAVASLNM